MARTIADAYVGLANVEGGRGNHDQAIVYLQKALAIEEKVQPDHPKVAVTLYNLGNSYFGVSRWHDGEEALRRSLALMEKRNGKNHPNIAMVLLVLAATLDKLHRTAEGLPLVERALAIVEKTGSDEELIAEIHDTLAMMLWKVPGGDRDRAAALARSALAHYKIDTPDLVVRKQALRKWMKARGIAP